MPRRSDSQVALRSTPTGTRRAANRDLILDLAPQTAGEHPIVTGGILAPEHGEAGYFPSTAAPVDNTKRILRRMRVIQVTGPNGRKYCVPIAPTPRRNTQAVQTLGRWLEFRKV